MTHYYIYRAEGPYVGTNQEYRVKLDWDGSDSELQDHLNEYGYQEWADNYESYGGYYDCEETDVEIEADYSFEEIDEDKYNQCGLFDFDISK